MKIEKHSFISPITLIVAFLRHICTGGYNDIDSDGEIKDRGSVINVKSIQKASCVFLLEWVRGIAIFNLNVIRHNVLEYNEMVKAGGSIEA